MLRCSQRGTPGEQYNIGGANEQTNLTIVDTICDLLEELAPAGANPAMMAAGVRHVLAISNASLPTGPATIAGMPSTVEVSPRPRVEAAVFVSCRVCARPSRWYVEHRDWFDAAQLGYNRERLGLGAVEGVAATLRIMTQRSD